MNIPCFSSSIHSDRTFSRKESFNRRVLEAAQNSPFAHIPRLTRLAWMMAFDGRPTVKTDDRGEYVTGYRPAWWFAKALGVCEKTILRWWKILAKFGIIDIWRISRGMAYRVRSIVSDLCPIYVRSINQTSDHPDPNSDQRQIATTREGVFADIQEEPKGNDQEAEGQPGTQGPYVALRSVRDLLEGFGLPKGLASNLSQLRGATVDRVRWLIEERAVTVPEIKRIGLVIAGIRQEWEVSRCTVTGPQQSKSRRSGAEILAEYAAKW